MTGLIEPRLRLGDPAHRAMLEAELDRLLAFGRHATHPAGGFGYLDEEGVPDPTRPAPLWVTARMTHVYALAQLLGREGAAELVDHGVRALRGPFRDGEYGGWYAAVTTDGPVGTDKTAYEHAFVVLAASSATVAGHPGAAALLAEALDVVEARFWDESAGMVVEQWDRAFGVLDGYRGLNATMHSVEAFLAAADVTGDARWRDRAARMVSFALHDVAPAHAWRLPEHYDSDWRPRLDYHREEPAHPFRPFGATVGHWLEWARLALHLRASAGADAAPWLLEHATALVDAAFREGWAVDGADGFVYTVDFAGRPVVRQRMHWVLAEAIGATAALARATGDAVHAERYAACWRYATAYLLDAGRGSWHHELDPDNRPDPRTWPGKPDLYHAVQATLIPRLPLAPSLASALAAGLLDRPTG